MAIPTDPRLKNRLEGRNQDQSRDADATFEVLQKFANQVSASALASIARDRASKRLQVEEQELAKAEQRQFQYPSLLSRVRLGKKCREEEAARMKQKQEAHTKNQEDLLRTLANTIHSSSSGQSPGSVQRSLTELTSVVESLQEKMKHMNAEIMALKESQTEESNINADQRSEISNIHERLGKQESLNSAVHELQDNMAHARGEIKAVKMKQRDAREEANNNNTDQRTAITHIQEHFSKQRNLTSAVDSLQENITYMSDELSSLKKYRLNAAKENIQNFAKIQSSINSLESKSKADHEQLSQKPESSLELQTSKIEPTSSDSINSRVISDIQNLSEQLQSLRDLQEQKDILIAEELENPKKTAQYQHDIIQSLSQNVDNLKKQIATLNPPYKDLFEKVNSHARVIHSHASGLTAHNFAIQSLETRYSNLSSEQIVCQMAAAMQEMYPYASFAQDEIHRLKSTTNSLLSDINGISAKIDAMTGQARTENQEETSRLTSTLKDVQSRIHDMELTTADQLAKSMVENSKTKQHIKYLGQKFEAAASFWNSKLGETYFATGQLEREMPLTPSDENNNISPKPPSISTNQNNNKRKRDEFS